MSRNALSIVLTAAILATTAVAVWAEENESPCAQGNCASSCKASTCASATDCLVSFSTTAESQPDSQCATSKSCTPCTDCAVYAAGVTAGNACKGCADCPPAANAMATIKKKDNCGADCSCTVKTTADQELPKAFAVLPSRLTQEIAKNAALTAKLQVHAELAQARKEFAQRMLKKESEIAHLHAELRLAHERIEMSEKIGAAVAENARLKASVELTHDRYELLKHAFTQKNSQQAESLAAALAESKADNARLMERIVVLEKQLETLRLQLANKPSDRRVK